MTTSFHGLTSRHLKSSAEVDAHLNDINSPEVDELWSIAASSKGLGPLADTPDADVFAYLNSDEFVQEILLTEAFQQASQSLKDIFQPFLTKAHSVAKLKEQLVSAYCAPAYALTFRPDKPKSVADLLNYELVIFDLVLSESAAAVDELAEYLEALSNQSPDSLPCLFIMSSRPELQDKRLLFSTKSNISAAGLFILPKSEIARVDFGAEGLRLSDRCLFEQREVAQHMRVFMRAWTAALGKATELAAEKLWNLDASTMQEIHFVAYSDRDPYDEHLSELIAREYLWHVESVPEVSKSIEAMDCCFQKFLDQETIKKRFITPLVDQKIARELLTHFNWTGLPSPKSFLAMDTEEVLRKFNRLVPFGALFAPPDIKEDTHCYVHITQQCDLNKSVREGKQISAQFAVVLPKEVKPHDLPVADTGVVARGLKVDGKEYDFKLVDGQQLAMPMKDFVEFAKLKKLTVNGRLRHDLATYFVAATANHMTRPALLKPTRMQIRRVKLYLYRDTTPSGAPIPFIDRDTNQPAVISIIQDKKRFIFPDDNCIYIALWLREQLSTHFGVNDLPTDKTCDKLGVGVSNKDRFVKCVTFRDFNCAAEDIVTAREALKPVPSADEVTLCLVYEPQRLE